jgi:hypothetical protein
MGPISRYPKGLLDFFGLKSMGQYPATVGDGISLSFDLSALLRWSDLETLFTIETVTNAGGAIVRSQGNIILWTVPQNELWVVNAWTQSLEATAGAGVQINSTWLQYRINGNGLFFPFMNGQSQAPSQFNSIAGGGASRFMGSNGLWVLTPGTNVVSSMSTNPTPTAGIDSTLSSGIAFNRLRV